MMTGGGGGWSGGCPPAYAGVGARHHSQLTCTDTGGFCVGTDAVPSLISLESERHCWLLWRNRRGSGSYQPIFEITMKEPVTGTSMPIVSFTLALVLFKFANRQRRRPPSTTRQTALRLTSPRPRPPFEGGGETRERRPLARSEGRRERSPAARAAAARQRDSTWRPSRRPRSRPTARAPFFAPRRPPGTTASHLFLSLSLVASPPRGTGRPVGNLGGRRCRILARHAVGKHRTITRIVIFELLECALRLCTTSDILGSPTRSPRAR
jgi:hypothetical protein